MRTQYDQQLKELNGDLIFLGSLCENAIGLAVKSFITANVEEAEKVAIIEKEINDKYEEIEKLCLKILLRQSPVATDFRTVSAALKMITDLERIGDQASDIAEIVRYSGIAVTYKCVAQMAQEAKKMVTQSIDAFVNADLVSASEVIKNDDVVDDLFITSKKEIVNNIKTSTSDEESEAIADCLLIIKYLERIADHATNIAEWVVFSITGEHKA